MLILLAGGSAAAETQPRPLRVAVDFAKDGWYAGALEEMVGRELSRFGSLEVAGKVGGGACAGRDARCLVDAYREAGVDVVVLGRVERNVLGYEVYATWARGRAFDGTLAVAHVDAATLRRHVGEIVRPIVQRGGLGTKGRNRQSATGNWQRATGNREPGTGNRKPETGNRKRGRIRDCWLRCSLRSWGLWPCRRCWRGCSSGRARLGSGGGRRRGSGRRW
jgi:hypothetical protein